MTPETILRDLEDTTNWDDFSAKALAYADRINLNVSEVTPVTARQLPNSLQDIQWVLVWFDINCNTATYKETEQS